MDTVSFVLVLIPALLLSTLALLALAYREHVRAEAAQRELQQVVRQYAAGYDTGLVEIVKVPSEA